MTGREYVLYAITVLSLTVNAAQAATVDMRLLNIGTMGIMMMIVATNFLWPGWPSRLLNRWRDR